MITLYQFAPALGLPNASPFCMKAELYLRMAGLPYRTKTQPLPMKAPKGKLPYIDDEGTVVADTGFIIEYLKGKYGDPLDAGLTALQRAEGHAFRRLFEEHLYWAVLHTRWFDPAGWAITREAFFGAMPAPMKLLASSMARKGLRKEIWGHGLGRHAPQDIVKLGRDDITAVADYLGDKPYLVGAAPSSFDATAYAFLANLIAVPLETPLKAHALQYANLRDYVERMRGRYFA